MSWYFHSSAGYLRCGSAPAAAIWQPHSLHRSPVCSENNHRRPSVVTRLTKQRPDNQVVSAAHRRTLLRKGPFFRSGNRNAGSLSVQLAGSVSAIVHTLPGDIDEARRWFSSPENCVRLIASRRWKDSEILCPVCGLPGPRFLTTRALWECKADHPKKQFSVRAGTLFEESHVSLQQWLTAIWILANSRAKVSSYRLARELGITQKSAWFLLFRVRIAFRLARQRLQAQIGLRHAARSL